VDRAARVVKLSDGSRLSYDYLVLAAGAVDQYFGHSEWSIEAPGLKSIDDATEIRRRFLLAFEAAEREEHPESRAGLLTTVVIGGGPTGVEMAGAMAEISRHTLRREFRHIDPQSARIILLEGGDRILPVYDPKLSERAAEALRSRGVEVRTGSIVTRIAHDAVYVGDERIPTRNVVWAAGVAASPLAAGLGVETDRGGRAHVGPDLSIAGHPEVFVIGDAAHALGPDGRPYPGLAPVAIQQGVTVARNIRRDLAGKARKPFHYRDKGTMSTIGRGDALAEIAGLRISGVIAWLTWLFVHLLYLVGFRNRVAVLIGWAWSYLTWKSGSRLITGDVSRDLDPLPHVHPEHDGMTTDEEPAHEAEPLWK
jgi:NADH dehydrogenase